MNTIRLEIKEIEYLKELVVEAWMYKRDSTKLTDDEQTNLVLVLLNALKGEK